MTRNESGYAATLLRPLHFAADTHSDHRRKGAEAWPYVNHPIAVAEILARVGLPVRSSAGVRNPPRNRAHGTLFG